MQKISNSHAHTRKRYFFKVLFDNRCHHINDELILYLRLSSEHWSDTSLSPCWKTYIWLYILHSHLVRNLLSIRWRLQLKKVTFVNYNTWRSSSYLNGCNFVGFGIIWVPNVTAILWTFWKANNIRTKSYEIGFIKKYIDL